MGRAGFVSRSAAVSSLRQKVVELFVLRIHLGALYSVDCHIGRVFRAMAALRRSSKPVILLGRQEHELAAAMPGDLLRFALRFVLEPAELGLKLKGAQFGQGILTGYRVSDSMHVYSVETNWADERKRRAVGPAMLAAS